MAQPSHERHPTVAAGVDETSNCRGRARQRRNERARRAILHAADDLLVELGFAGVTVEAIAARAGVGKQTIYRWWSSKTEVLLECLLEDAAEDLPRPDTGRVGEDLRVRLRELSHFLAVSDAGRVERALLGEAQHSPSLAVALRATYLQRERDRDRLLIARAIERAELPPDLDIEVALDQLLGPVYYRELVTGQPVDDGYTDALVASFLAACSFSR